MAARHDTELQIERLLVDTGSAHHQAFLATDGEDPEWALWYARHLQDPLAKLLNRSFSVVDLTRTVSELAEAHAAKDPDAAWPAFYAEELVQRFLANDNEKLALYHFQGCPYCAMVRRAIDGWGLDVELRDIHAHDEHWEALVGACGRPTVPVLRCSAGGVDRWLPESRDIITYLEGRVQGSGGSGTNEG